MESRCTMIVLLIKATEVLKKALGIHTATSS
jgi:hypothetical protein